MIPHHESHTRHWHAQVLVRSADSSYPSILIPVVVVHARPRKLNADVLTFSAVPPIVIDPG